MSVARLIVKPFLEVKINNNNNKRKKKILIFYEIMSSTMLKDLPNEIITKVLSYLETRDLFFFGHLSTRTRAISRDGALWQKVTVYNKTLKSEFLEFMLRNGCKFLKLTDVQLNGSLHLRKSSVLTDLSLDGCAIKHQVLEEFLASCHCLTKFTLRDMDVSDVQFREGTLEKRDFNFEVSIQN